MVIANLEDVVRKLIFPLFVTELKNTQNISVTKDTQQSATTTKHVTGVQLLLFLCPSNH